MAGVEQATASIEPDRKLIVPADFTEPGSARTLWREAVAWRGRIDVLVNNAAIMPETPIDSDDEVWDATWAQILQVNVVEPASLMREAVRHFRAAGGGSSSPCPAGLLSRVRPSLSSPHMRQRKRRSRP